MYTKLSSRSIRRESDWRLIVPEDRLDEVKRLAKATVANDTEFGLIAYVGSADPERANRVARKLPPAAS